MPNPGFTFMHTMFKSPIFVQKSRFRQNHLVRICKIQLSLMCRIRNAPKLIFGQNRKFWSNVLVENFQSLMRIDVLRLDSKDSTVSSFSLTNRLGKVMKAPVQVFLRVFFLVLRHRFLYN